MAGSEGADEAMALLQQDLDKSGHAGTALQVVDVRLHASHHHRPIRSGELELLHEARDPGGLDSVTDLRARAMSLDQLAVVIGALGVRLLHAPVLRVPRRLGDRPRALAVVVQGRADDLAPALHGDAALVARVLHCQHQGAAALAAPVALRIFVEGEAPVAAHAPFHEGDGHFDVQREVASLAECKPNLASADRRHTEVHRSMRRGASGVHGHAGSPQVERVSDTRRENGVGHANSRLRRGLRLAEHLFGVVVHRTHVDRMLPALDPLKRQPSVLIGSGGRLKQHVLQRVRALRLCALHGESRVIKAEGVLDEGTAPRELGPTVDVIAVGRHLACAVRVVEQCLPVVLGAVGNHREAVREAQDAHLFEDAWETRQSLCLVISAISEASASRVSVRGRH
mmetsp:Transcript_96037/g.215115  ORF Transcript_96037/g.215115 Transcript_96037/m.215115 type:complete len:398 (-) Transcript_96037:140-1333(-)